MDEEIKEAFQNAYMELGGLGERVLGAYIYIYIYMVLLHSTLEYSNLIGQSQQSLSNIFL